MHSWFSKVLYQNPTTNSLLKLWIWLKPCFWLKAAFKYHDINTVLSQILWCQLHLPKISIQFQENWTGGTFAAGYWYFLAFSAHSEKSQPFTLIFQLSFKLRQLDSLAALEKPGWTFSPEQVGWDPTSRNYLCWSVVRIFNEYRLKSEIKEAPHFRSNETDLSVFHEILM